VDRGVARFVIVKVFEVQQIGFHVLAPKRIAS
jgi:hypothetical protein